MKMLLHALFPKDLDPQAHEAFDTLTREGVADPGFEHVCVYDHLEHTPDFHRSGIILYALGGAAVLGVVGIAVGAALGASGLGQMPTPTAALLGGIGFASLGGLASALGGIGAPDPGIAHAARNLGAGRMMMTFALTEGRFAEKAERILEEFGALEVHQQLR